MAGLAAAFALKCLAVRGLCVFDRAPEGFEGPWATTARMETLRSPPELSGPSFQFASLTFRAWFEAQFGAAEWGKLYRIPRLQWMDYLRWYRRMIDVPVENGTELIDIGGDGELVVLTLRSASGTRKVAARRVVLANGRDGLGGPYTPEIFRGLDPRFVMHSLGEIDFSELARQDRRRHRRRIDRLRLRRGSARARRRARRDAGAARRRAAHQQEHGHRQRGLLAGLLQPRRRAEVGDRELRRRSGRARAAQLDAALQPQQEFLDHRALRGARRGRSRWSRGARHDARQARVRSPDPRDRPCGRLEPAAGIRCAQAARPALARSFCARWKLPTMRRPSIRISARISNSCRASAHRTG